MTEKPSFAKLDAEVEAIEADVAQHKIPLTSPDTMSENASDFMSDNTSDTVSGKALNSLSEKALNSLANRPPKTGRKADSARVSGCDSKIIDLSERLSQNKMSEADLDQAETILEGLSADIWREISDELNQSKPSLQNLHRNSGEVSPKASAGTAGHSPLDKRKQPTFNADSINPDAQPELPLAVRKKIEEFEAERAASAARLEEIQKGIDKYWVRYAPKPNPTARALGAVLSLGFVVVTVLYGSYWLGTYIVNRTGQGWFLPLCLILGMLGGFYMGFILLAPIIKPRFDTAGNPLPAGTPTYPERQPSHQVAGRPKREPADSPEAESANFRAAQPQSRATDEPQP